MLLPAYLLMTLLSLILALLLEQFHPLPVQRYVINPLRRWAEFFDLRLNDGDATHGRIAWMFAVLPLVFGSAIAYFFLWHLSPFVALIFNIGVLYLTMGFRHESHFFTDIQFALRQDNLDEARRLLQEWTGISYHSATPSEVARVAIEQALVSSHRQVFAVVFWFLLLPGPSGAILYRMTEFLGETWGAKQDPDGGEFGVFAQRFFWALDWLPVRMTATAFSIVGDFEDAVFCWRTQSGLWPDLSAGILIASGAGALGVRLGMPVHQDSERIDRPEMGLGNEADIDVMQSTVGLVWRSIVLWLLLLLLIGLTRVAG